jgi:hypothetical protein
MKLLSNPGSPKFEMPTMLTVNAKISTNERTGYNILQTERKFEPKKVPDSADSKSTKEDLKNIKPALADMAITYDHFGGKGLESTMKLLVGAGSIMDDSMRSVANEMFDHFIDGSGTDYRNDILTQTALKEPAMQNWVKRIIKELYGSLNRNNGNLEAVAGDKTFNKIKDVRPVLGNLTNGLTICVNDTWGNYIDIDDYYLDGKNYSGTIKFTVYDTFGLDENDVTSKNPLKNISSFYAWFVLQHYEGSSGKYKPFTTYIEFEVPFGGSVD